MERIELENGKISVICFVTTLWKIVRNESNKLTVARLKALATARKRRAPKKQLPLEARTPNQASKKGMVGGEGSR